MQFTWNGNTGSYTDAGNWTPEDVPLYDMDNSALIQSGTVMLSNTAPNNIAITLAGASADTQPNFVLDNAAFGPGVRLSLVPPSVDGRPPTSSYATITVEGYDTTQATISLASRPTSPDFLAIAIAPYSQLNQQGTIDVGWSDLRVNGTDGAPATLNNDGIINVGSGTAVISVDVIGSGTIAFAASATGSGPVTLRGGVAPSQHIAFNQSASASLRIDNPSAFHGILDEFSAPFDSITLANTQADRAYFAQITPDFGELLLLNRQEVVSALTVTGTHAADAYGVSSNLDGSTTVRPMFPVPSS